MQKIGDNKIVYNTIEEILDPSHTALVVWDVQHGTTKVIFNKEEFCRNLNSVIELARKSKNIPIFFTPIQIPSKRFESSAISYTLGLYLDFYAHWSSTYDWFSNNRYTICI